MKKCLQIKILLSWPIKGILRLQFKTFNLKEQLWEVEVVLVIFQSLVLKAMQSFKVENLHLLKEIRELRILLGNHKVLARIKTEHLKTSEQDRLVQELELVQDSLSKDLMKWLDPINQKLVKRHLLAILDLGHQEQLLNLRWVANMLLKVDKDNLEKNCMHRIMVSQRQIKDYDIQV